MIVAFFLLFLVIIKVLWKFKSVSPLIRREGFSCTWVRVQKGKHLLETRKGGDESLLGRQDLRVQDQVTRSAASALEILFLGLFSLGVLHLEFIRKLFPIGPIAYSLLTFLSSVTKCIRVCQGTAAPFTVGTSPPQIWSLHGRGVCTTANQSELRTRLYLFFLPFPFQQPCQSTPNLILSFIFKNKALLLSNLHLKIQQTNTRNYFLR